MLLDDFLPPLTNGIRRVKDALAETGANKNQEVDSLVVSVSKEFWENLKLETEVRWKPKDRLSMNSEGKLTPSEFKEKLENGDLPKEGKIVVNGSLKLTGSVRELPDNLTIEGDLDLSGCTDLTCLPDNLLVKKDLNLKGCKKLISLPNSIIEWGGLPDGGTRIIDLRGTGVSETVLSKFRQSDHPGIWFRTSESVDENEILFKIHNERMQSFKKKVEETRQKWESLLPQSIIKKIF